MMKLYEIYGTTELPIYGIITNIGTVDLSRDETVNVTIQTSQPGIFWGSHSTDLNGAMMPESKNYTELINQELKKLFHVEFIEVKIEEVSALQLMDF
jgi:ribosomal protein S3